MHFKWFFGCMVVSVMSSCSAQNRRASIDDANELRMSWLNYDSSVIEAASFHSCVNVRILGKSKALCDNSVLNHIAHGESCEFQGSKVAYSLYDSKKAFCIDAAGCGENSVLYDRYLLDSIFNVSPKDSCVRAAF